METEHSTSPDDTGNLLVPYNSAPLIPSLPVSHRDRGLQFACAGDDPQFYLLTWVVNCDERQRIFGRSAAEDVVAERSVHQVGRISYCVLCRIYILHSCQPPLYVTELTLEKPAGVPWHMEVPKPHCQTRLQSGFWKPRSWAAGWHDGWCRDFRRGSRPQHTPP